jgi:hypothetical protein
MKRSLPANIEYAAFGGPASAVATKLRNAPRWVHDRLGRRPAPPAAKTVAAKPVAVKRTTPRQPVATLVVALAPGVSRPVTLVGGNESLPETISPRAWRGVLEQLANGRKVPIQVGHQKLATLVAAAGTSRVRCRLCPTGGLMLQVDLLDTDVVGPLKGASIAFRPRTYHRATVDGRTVRVIDSLSLDHIALIEANDSVNPVYPLAKAVRCKPRESAGTLFQMVADTARAMSTNCPNLQSIYR